MSRLFDEERGESYVEETPEQKRLARIHDYETDGALLFEAINDAPFQWAFASDDEMRRFVDRFAVVPGARFADLVAERALGEAAIRALQSIWKDFNDRKPLSEREQALALYVEAVVAPKIDDDLGVERSTLVAQLAASLLAPGPGARRIGELTKPNRRAPDRGSFVSVTALDAERRLALRFAAYVRELQDKNADRGLSLLEARRLNDLQHFYMKRGPVVSQNVTPPDAA